MRHAKRSSKLNVTTSHRRAMFANMLKSLITNGRIVTTTAKAKEVRRFADKMITLAKKNTLSSKRQAVSELMIRYNSLTTKDARSAKKGETQAFNTDRNIINKLFSELGPRFANRQGGYTRLVRIAERRIGDDAEECILEYLSE